ncbi:thermonuclease family protein [Campylobacter sp. RM16192]|uniref:thermonuclease family protein n=1 Tax=Campylobacter sp. RM16192 TaxID=1660080 RepID=UPI001451E303|nr:thermonuclease family protein [Campylobacter sp. RM16192]QCD52826.1 endonuclease, thermonuclease family [Campylobacter sp. RM16192]
MKAILLLTLILPTLALALSGKVIKVSDGDTITILQNKQQIKVRLFGIDAPEKKQAYGEKSRKFLANLIAGQIIEVREKGKDKYKRVLGVVFHKGQDINAQMVSNGYAWAFIKYSKDYVKHQEYAVSKKFGLWADKEPVAPWEWRKR